jgi:hypothetical protein
MNINVFLLFILCFIFIIYIGNTNVFEKFNSDLNLNDKDIITFIKSELNNKNMEAEKIKNMNKDIEQIIFDNSLKINKKLIKQNNTLRNINNEINKLVIVDTSVEKLKNRCKTDN